MQHSPTQYNRLRSTLLFCAATPSGKCEPRALERTHENATQPRTGKEQTPASTLQTEWPCRKRMVMCSRTSLTTRRHRFLDTRTEHDATLLFLQDANTVANESRKVGELVAASAISRALHLTYRGYCHRCGRTQHWEFLKWRKDSACCELCVEKKKLAYSSIRSVVSSSCLRNCFCTDSMAETSGVKFQRFPNEQKSTAQILTQSGCSTFIGAHVAHD